MSSRKIDIFLFVTVLALATLACNAFLPAPEPTIAPSQTLVATQIVEPVSAQPQANLPESEAAVPRVSVEEASAAFDSGEAIIVDVRSADAYAASHVVGAINIPLGEIETNSAGLSFDKEQWIITYCT